MGAESVRIHYRRLPDREVVFEQPVIETTDECVVTLLQAASIDRPVTAGGRVVLEPGSPVVWFTFPGRWHDIGRFHLADGTFTGFYANILTPVRMDGSRWETTDLCLDVWLGTGGEVELLDEEEFEEAVRRGWIDPETEAAARREASLLQREALEGQWPPATVRAWDLTRARAAIGTVK